MGEKAKETNEVTVIEISSSPSDADGSPLRPIFCLKNRMDLKEFDEKEDCFILDFDPDDDVDISKLSVTEDFDASGSPDLAVVAEKGQIACRDYPHSRHVCVKFPFEKTPHETYCELCHCYVCDSVAPCEYWSGPKGHCHAIHDEAWKLYRKLKKELSIKKS